MKIVLAYFPHNNDNSSRAEKAHICIELSQFEHKGRVFSVLVYGTSKMTRRHEDKGVISIRKEDFIKVPLGEIADVGHFVGGRIAVLPSTPFWIVPDHEGEISTQHVTALEMREFMHHSAVEARKLLQRLIVTGKYGVP